MPTYDFRCPQCGGEQTYTMRYEERATRTFTCPKCQVPLAPVMRPFFAKTSRKS